MRWEMDGRCEKMGMVICIGFAACSDIDSISYIHRESIVYL
jgi:hypothetical protein